MISDTYDNYVEQVYAGEICPYCKSKTKTVDGYYIYKKMIYLNAILIVITLFFNEYREF